jgi:hypothetical protein
METVQAAWRNREDSEWVIVSEVCLDSERYLSDIVERPDRLRLDSSLVETLPIQRNVPVRIPYDLFDLLLLDPLQLLGLQ